MSCTATDTTLPDYRYQVKGIRVSTSSPKLIPLSSRRRVILN